MDNKFELKNDIIAGFKSRTQDDIDEAMSDFGDYLSIVDGEIRKFDKYHNLV